MGEKKLVGMGDFVAVMGEIVKFAPGSVKRVNFFTHANGTTVGIAGRNIPGNVMFDTQVTKADLDNFATNGMSFKVGNQTFDLDDVRQRFTKDAVFVLYGCQAGLNKPLFDSLHALLGIKVIGFKKKIAFCPNPPQNGQFVRTGMLSGIGNCSSKTADWRSLANDPAETIVVP